MIIEVRAKNCFIFEEDISFSLKADMRNKKFGANVHRENNFNIVKTASIYGPNNAGKSCLIKCIEVIKSFLLNEEFSLSSNFFSDGDICELGITFLHLGRKFSYDLKYESKAEEVLFEKFEEIVKDKYGNENSVNWLIKDSINNTYNCKDQKLQDVMSLMSDNNLLMHMVDANKFPGLKEMKDILVNFASKIDIVSKHTLSLNRTMDLMKNENNLKNKVIKFILSAGLYIDDFNFVPMDKISREGLNNSFIKLLEDLKEEAQFVSVYKGVPVPSFIFDSEGTRKFEALASYIIEALQGGRILVIDNLDSDLHFTLSRAIVRIFNNELNVSAQLIFTTHDINLLDCKKVFRKEQIWFVHKDNKGVYMYSLADFTARQGIRDTTDIIDKYKKGVLGALPFPDFIDTLLDVGSTTQVE